MVVNCLVTLCVPVNASVYRIVLQPGEDQGVNFKAGQYLNIQKPDGSSSPFSIASTPDQTGTLELHIDRHDTTDAIIRHLQDERSIKVDLPLGDCHLPTPLNFAPDAPIILVAASTGFAQMQSILLKLFNSATTNPIHLYWGTKRAEGFYLLDQIVQWQEKHNHFHFTPVVSDATENCQWQGREGLLHQVIVEDFDDLSDAQVYISGSPLMVYATLDVLVEKGLPEEQAHSDVFSYAPRVANQG
ncbi:MAG: NAD(P)H-flavin reductase [Pseudomonadales bacterium]